MPVVSVTALVRFELVSVSPGSFGCEDGSLEFGVEEGFGVTDGVPIACHDHAAF